MDRDTNGMLRALVSSWEDLTVELGRLKPSAQVKPADGYAVFRPAAGGSTGTIRFDVGPIVFNVPERAQHPRNDLFVVVQGRLEFDRTRFADDKDLVSMAFGTEVGYFRRTKDALDHVYGAHYDFSVADLGHPTFHAQMKSFAHLASEAKKHYGELGDVRDSVRGLLRNVRIPTAHMDVFSLFLQLCADHMLWKDSGPEERAAFDSLLATNGFCQGSAHRVPRLGGEAARGCYRARHWYPTVAEMAPPAASNPRPA